MECQDTSLSDFDYALELLFSHLSHCRSSGFHPQFTFLSYASELPHLMWKNNNYLPVCRKALDSLFIRINVYWFRIMKTCDRCHLKGWNRGNNNFSSRCFLLFFNEILLIAYIFIISLHNIFCFYWQMGLGLLLLLLRLFISSFLFFIPLPSFLHHVFFFWGFL